MKFLFSVEKLNCKGDFTYSYFHKARYVFVLIRNKGGKQQQLMDFIFKEFGIMLSVKLITK